MTFRKILIFAIALFSAAPSFAHKVGSSDWCLMYTLTHWECVYTDANHCEETLKSVMTFAKKNPGKPLVEGEKEVKKIEPSCQSNPNSIPSTPL